MVERSDSDCKQTWSFGSFIHCKNTQIHFLGCITWLSQGCFTGECINEDGRPITHMLARRFGLPFILGYVASYMLVAMGIFNVILAVPRLQ